MEEVEREQRGMYLADGGGCLTVLPLSAASSSDKWSALRCLHSCGCWGRSWKCLLFRRKAKIICTSSSLIGWLQYAWWQGCWVNDWGCILLEETHLGALTFLGLLPRKQRISAEQSSWKIHCQSQRNLALFNIVLAEMQPIYLQGSVALEWLRNSLDYIKI